MFFRPGYLNLTFMSHQHHHDHENLSDSRLVVAIILNLLLSLAEAVGGILGGSLSLVADAVHNFNDCASLFIALVARRVSRRQADEFRTFGYRRAEVIGALINLTALILVSIYLIYEAITRYFQPQVIHGWMVIGIAAIALFVDVATVLLLRVLGKSNLNVRAAALHNLSDALASVAVIIVGVGVLVWDLNLLDVVVTLIIAGYILWQSFDMLQLTMGILMESVPAGLKIQDLQAELANVADVIDVHHIHVWQVDEHHRIFEAHVVIAVADFHEMESIKNEMKRILNDSFEISHSTLEFEIQGHASAHDTALIPKH